MAVIFKNGKHTTVLLILWTKLKFKIIEVCNNLNIKLVLKKKHLVEFYLIVISPTYRYRL